MGLGSTSWGVFPGSPSWSPVCPCSGRVCSPRGCGSLSGVTRGGKWPQMKELEAEGSCPELMEAAQGWVRTERVPCGSRELREGCPTGTLKGPIKDPLRESFSHPPGPRNLIRNFSAPYVVPSSHPILPCWQGKRKSRWWVSGEADHGGTSRVEKRFAARSRAEYSLLPVQAFCLLNQDYVT